MFRQLKFGMLVYDNPTEYIDNVLIPIYPEVQSDPGADSCYNANDMYIIF